MARKSEPQTIGDRTFVISQMPPITAQDGISRISAVFGEAISALWDGKGGALKAIAAMGARSKDAELSWLRAHYLANTKLVVEIKDDQGNVKQTHEIAATADVIADFDLSELNEWFIAHSTLNYRDFFVGLIVSSATRLSSLSSTLDSETDTAGST